MDRETGTTTIELLVAATTGLLVTGAALALVVTGNRATRALLERQGAWMHARAASALWAAEWRGAGFDPAGTSGATVTRVHPETLEFAADWNADGGLLPTSTNPNERLAYAAAPGAWRRGVNGGPRLPLARPDSVRFGPHDAAGLPLAPPVDPAAVVRVDVHAHFSAGSRHGPGLEVVWSATRRVAAP